MRPFSFCLYYTALSYYVNRPDKVGLRWAATPDALVAQVMGEYQLPFVAHAVVSSGFDPNRRVWLTSCRFTECGLSYALEQFGGAL